MANSKYYYYFVEGQDEEKLVSVLKTDLKYIISGKVQVFNVIEQKLTKLRIMSLKPNTIVILIFDTDSGNSEILLENIKLLQKETNVKEVICITQVKNLEQELIRSCNIKEIKELTNSKSNKDFKRDLIKDTQLGKKLLNHKFDFDIFWASEDKKFQNVKNEAYKIKIKNK